MLNSLYKSGIINKVILAVIACLVVVLISYLFWQPNSEKLNRSFEGKEWFRYQPLLTNIYRIFDLGVVDVNSDNNLDIFTSNHNHGQLLLIGDGQSGFDDNTTANWGLDQDRDFPGLEYAGQEPSTKEPGLHIYWKERSLVIKNQKNDYPVKGTVKFFASVKVKQTKNFQTNITEKTIDTGAEASSVDFASQQATGIFEFRPGNVSLPISFEFDSQLPLEQIYIGNLKLHPKSHKFSFYLRDRHGMAWMDYDDSGKKDVFIVRGGLKGRLNIIPQQFDDELLVEGEDGVYRERIAKTGIVKDVCPALQTAWVDVNSDHLLDLYTVCYRGAKDDTSDYFNQLYQQQGGQKFVEIADSANLAFPEMGTFAWLDTDRDGDSDLLWVNDEAFWLYKNDQGTFTSSKIADNPGSVWGNFEDSNKLTLADYDNDGDLDIFAASSQGNALLIDNDGDYSLANLTELGLPSQGMTADWVDYDNDGLTDLYVFPAGLYHQLPNGEFENTGMLASQSKELLEAKVTWFDADNNGTRDLLLATRYQDSLSSQIYQKLSPEAIQTSMWQMTLYPNLNSTNHWLEIELVGDAQNRQAIGSRVEITMPEGVKTAMVGQAEGSHFSQGHYRLYFGLGRQPTINNLKVFWSNGYVQELNNLAGDRLLTINQDQL